MNEETQVVQTTASLLKALVAALIVATVLFVTMVLPAEFDIDPTGVGQLLGLNGLAVIGAETEPETVVRAGEGELAFREDEVEIEIRAGAGLEYKFYLSQYANLTYEWSSPSPLYFDLHGEPEGDTTGYFESYGAASANGMKGSVTTPFSGSHGWYWRNEGDEASVVTLKTRGNYEVLGLR